MPSGPVRAPMIGLALFVAIALLLATAAAAFMTAMPGRSHPSRLPPATAEEAATAERLRRHVSALALSERHVGEPQALERAARYIEAAFAREGLGPRAHRLESAGRSVRNIEVVLPRDAAPDVPALVVGAHYDSVPGSPGADDNASGVAALIELGRLLSAEPLPQGRAVRLVAFVNEEPPWFMSEAMGSEAWARRARGGGQPILGMLSLEMLGYYREAAGSQRYPFPLTLFYPDRGDFLAFVGDLGSRALVRQATGAFRRAATLPSEGLAAPSAIPGVMWSDHWSFRRHGYPAIMVTDTAFYRNPNYHAGTDTPERLDYDRFSRATVGLAAVVRELVR